MSNPQQDVSTMKPSWGCIVLALLLSLCSVLGWWLDPEWMPQGPRLLITLFVFAALACALSILLAAAARTLATWSDHAEVSTRKGETFLLFVPVVLAWLVVFVVCLPGSYCADWLGQVEQFYSHTFTNHHPVLMTLVYGSIYALGNAVAGTPGGVLLTTSLQMAGTLTIVYYILLWSLRLNVARPARIALATYFAFCPVLAVAAQWVAKDVLSFILMGLLAFQMVIALEHTDNDEMPPLAHPFPFALSALLCTLSRANCVYVVAPGLLALAFHLTGVRRWHYVGIVALICALYSGWNSLLPALGIRSGSIVEAMSVPLQQTASYLVRYPDDITEEEAALIEQISSMPPQQLAGRYDAGISDPVKDVIHFSDSQQLLGYLRIWWEMGLRHPLLYVRTFLVGSRGYWAPTLNPHRAYTLFDRPYSALDLPGSSEHVTAFNPLFPEVKEGFIRLLWNVAGLPFVSLFFVPATYILATLLLGTYGLSRRRPVGPLMTMAVLMALVCCASPLYASMRYAFPFLWYLPLMLIVVTVSNKTPTGARHLAP